jgi:hypothetical protein
VGCDAHRVFSNSATDFPPLTTLQIAMRRLWPPLGGFVVGCGVTAAGLSFKSRRHGNPSASEGGTQRVESPAASPAVQVQAPEAPASGSAAGGGTGSGSALGPRADQALQPTSPAYPRDSDTVVRRGYVACVDRRTRIPKWVVEDFVGGKGSGSGKSHGHWQGIQPQDLCSHPFMM